MALPVALPAALLVTKDGCMMAASDRIEEGKGSGVQNSKTESADTLRICLIMLLLCCLPDCIC
jgi:hypothetical protein